LEKIGKFLLIYKKKVKLNMLNMLNIDEASKLLGVCKKTLRNWEKNKKITSVRTFGGHRRYNKEDLLKMINKDEMDKR
jgi:excisionase family DNA binding protein